MGTYYLSTYKLVGGVQSLEKLELVDLIRENNTDGEIAMWESIEKERFYVRCTNRPRDLEEKGIFWNEEKESKEV